MKEEVAVRVDKVLEKLVGETPVEKVLIMDAKGALVRAFPHEEGDEDLARMAFGMVNSCITTSRGLGMGDPIKVELGSKRNSLIIVGVDRRYLVTLKARGKIDAYMLLANVIKLFHEYNLGTMVSRLPISSMATE
ncbi:MAG: hypothetical protein KAT70_01275 [Thermoplasmata archaeon]|nr:hypothetical protein [Thermoplasmata archaeon]